MQLGQRVWAVARISIDDYNNKGYYAICPAVIESITRHRKADTEYSLLVNGHYESFGPEKVFKTEAEAKKGLDRFVAGMLADFERELRGPK